MANENITSILETLDTLTVIELSELVSAVEERYAVSAAAASRYIREPVGVVGKLTVDTSDIAAAECDCHGKGVAALDILTTAYGHG